MTNQPPSASGSAPTVTAPMTMSLWRWYFTYEGPPFTIAHQRIAMDVSNFGPSVAEHSPPRCNMRHFVRFLMILRYLSLGGAGAAGPSASRNAPPPPLPPAALRSTSSGSKPPTHPQGLQSNVVGMDLRPTAAQGNDGNNNNNNNVEDDAEWFAKDASLVAYHVPDELTKVVHQSVLQMMVDTLLRQESTLRAATSVGEVLSNGDRERGIDGATFRSFASVALLAVCSAAVQPILSSSMRHRVEEGDPFQCGGIHAMDALLAAEWRSLRPSGKYLPLPSFVQWLCQFALLLSSPIGGVQHVGKSHTIAEATQLLFGVLLPTAQRWHDDPDVELRRMATSKPSVTDPPPLLSWSHNNTHADNSNKKRSTKGSTTKKKAAVSPPSPRNAIRTRFPMLPSHQRVTDESTAMTKERVGVTAQDKAVESMNRVLVHGKDTDLISRLKHKRAVQAMDTYPMNFNVVTL